MITINKALRARIQHEKYVASIEVSKAHPVQFTYDMAQQEEFEPNRIIRYHDQHFLKCKTGWTWTREMTELSEEQFLAEIIKLKLK